MGLDNEKLVMTNVELEKLLKKDSWSFKGVIMSDEIITKVNPNIESSFIINYDTTDGEGTHWVALKVDGRNIYYFDAFGIPPLQGIIDLEKRFKKKLIYNSIILQPLNSVICGHLSAVFIILMDEFKNDFNHVLQMLQSKIK